MKKISLFLLLFVTIQLFADNVFLKDGTRVHGIVKEIIDNVVHVRMKNGSDHKIKQEKIESIVFSEYDTGVYDGVYRNFNINISFNMPADYWKLHEGNNKNGWLFTLSKRDVIKEDDTTIKVYSKLLDNKEIPKDEKHFIRFSEANIKKYLPSDYIRINKDILITNEVKYFRQWSSYEKAMIMGNKLRFKQINLATIRKNRLFLFIFDSSIIKYDRDTKYFYNMMSSFKFIDNYPVYDVFYNLGGIFFYEKKYKQALKYYDLAYKKKISADLINRIGMCYARLGDFKNAKKSFKQAFDMMPEDERIKYNLEKTGKNSYSGFGF